jgi:rRNA maturation endonuclease Nob1
MPLIAAVARCKKCGSEIRTDWKFCPGCGDPIACIGKHEPACARR